MWCGEECGVANKMPHGAHMVRETIAVRPKKNGFQVAPPPEAGGQTTHPKLAGNRLVSLVKLSQQVAVSHSRLCCACVTLTSCG